MKGHPSEKSRTHRTTSSDHHRYERCGQDEPISRLHGSVGNRGVMRMLQQRISEQSVATRQDKTTDANLLAHDTDDTSRKQEAAQHRSDVEDFGTLSVRPIYAKPGAHAASADIPRLGEMSEIVDQPLAGPGGGSGAAPVPMQANGSDGCGTPRSMQKLTSGTFLGGLSMDSYYPDLAGAGFYTHPSSAGAFDTGSRVGANIQLLGVIPSPCRPSQYQLQQTITRTRYRINGTVHPEEGQTFDDIAKSGRNASTAPFRQDFLGGGTAPLGYIISMADPPSTYYNNTDRRDVEHDRDFVTSLQGPSGTQSVSWSLSTRVSGGVVTSNVLT
jgi:hypothetical protein